MAAAKSKPPKGGNKTTLGGVNTSKSTVVTSTTKTLTRIKPIIPTPVTGKGNSVRTTSRVNEAFLRSYGTRASQRAEMLETISPINVTAKAASGKIPFMNWDDDFNVITKSSK